MEPTSIAAMPGIPKSAVLPPPQARGILLRKRCIFLVSTILLSAVLGHPMSYHQNLASRNSLLASEAQAMLPFLLASVLTALLEVYTKSIDNLSLPLFFCAFLKVLEMQLGTSGS